MLCLTNGRSVEPLTMADASSPAAHQYIHLVQHLIEECIVFNMSKEECVEALFKHADIKPVITATVWKELEKENKEFFEAYTKNREEIRRGASHNDHELLDTSSSRQRIINHKKMMLLDSSSSSSTPKLKYDTNVDRA